MLSNQNALQCYELIYSSAKAQEYGLWTVKFWRFLALRLQGLTLISFLFIPIQLPYGTIYLPECVLVLAYLHLKTIRVSFFAGIFLFFFASFVVFLVGAVLVLAFAILPVLCSFLLNCYSKQCVITIVLLATSTSNGWVLDVAWWQHSNTDCILVIGKVHHSYSSKTPSRPWVIIKPSGSVVCGHCTCMAGQGETCSHIVGTVLYWLHIYIRDKKPCTTKVNIWIEWTAVKDIIYLMLKDIDFTSAKKKLKCTYEGEGQQLVQQLVVLIVEHCMKNTLHTIISLLRYRF